MEQTLAIKFHNITILANYLSNLSPKSQKYTLSTTTKSVSIQIKLTSRTILHTEIHSIHLYDITETSHRQKTHHHHRVWQSGIRTYVRIWYEDFLQPTNVWFSDHVRQRTLNMLIVNTFCNVPLKSFPERILKF